MNKISAIEPIRFVAKNMRLDLRLMAEMIAPGSRVLDIGCGDGTLLDFLVHEKQVDGRGLELSMDGVHTCVSRGLSVIQGNADRILPYPKTGERLRGLIRDMQLVVIDGGPHAIAWTHADQVNRALLGFLT